MATELDVVATYLPNWAISGESFAAGDTVQVCWRLDEDGVDSLDLLRRRGTGPTIEATVYEWDALDQQYEDGAGTPLPSFLPAPTEFSGPQVLYIPAFQIQPTSDWLRPKPGRYTVSFVLASGRKQPWDDWTDIVVPADASPLTWMQISEYSKGGVAMFGYNETFSKEEILQMLSTFVPTVSGIARQVFATPTVGSGFAALRALEAGDVASGVFNVARLASGSPTASTVVAGDGAWKSVPAVLGYTPENTANRGAVGGYAPLDGGSKVPLANITEVIGLANVSDVNNAAAPTNGHFLVGNGSVWSNRALVSGDVTTGLGYTPENLANKGGASGYAPLDGSSKVPSTHITEVISLVDLANVAANPSSTSPLVHLQGGAIRALGGFPNGASATNVVEVPVLAAVTPPTDFNYTAVNTYTTDPREYHYWAMYIPGPGKLGFGVRGVYSDANDGGANFNFMSYVQNTGGRNTVAGGFLAIQRAAGTIFAINPAGLVDVAGAVAGTAIGAEIDFGSLGTSTAAKAYGLCVYSLANANTVKGTAQAYIQMAISDVADANQPRARALEGIVFVKTGSDSPVMHNVAYGGSDDNALLAAGTGALFKAQGCEANFVGNFTNMNIGFGFDFAGATVLQATLRLPMNMPGIAVVDDNNTGVYNAVRHSTGDQLFFGDFAQNSSHGIEEMRFHVKGAANRCRVEPDGFGAVHLNGWNGSNTAPSIGTGAFTGGGSPANPSITSASVAGRDPGHTVSFTTTAGPVADQKICAVTFVETYTTAPIVVVASANAGGRTVAGGQIHAENITASGYELWSGDSALAATTAYAVQVVVIGY